MKLHAPLAAAIFTLTSAALHAQDKPKKWEAMDYGPFLSASFLNPQGKSTLDGKGCASNKGIAVSLGSKEAGAIFDTETLRLAGAWTGGWVKLKGVAFDGSHGPNPGPVENANILFQNSPGPGWSKGGDFNDPRQLPVGPGAAKVPLGPLPKEWAKYRGLYVSGDKVVFAYTVGDALVLEHPALEKAGAVPLLSRTFNVVKNGAGAKLAVADIPEGGKAEERGGAVIVTDGETASSTALKVLGAPAGAKLAIEGSRVVFNLPALTAGQNFKVVATGNQEAIRQAALAANPRKDLKFGFAVGTTDSGEALRNAARDLSKKQKTPEMTQAQVDEQANKWTSEIRAALKTAMETAAAANPVDLALLDKAAPAADLKALTKGGPLRWKETLTTKGELSKDEKSSYVLDSIGVPFENPYASWLRFGGLDFFKDGRAVLTTWSGDVWIVSGIDQGLENVTWKRYASGLFHALGARIVDNQLYVLGRDQITRLEDINNDGEADLYENFNNDVQITPNFHEFAFDLQTDPQGNFYFTKGGPVNPGGRGWGPLSNHHGCIFKISKDGQKFEVFATGIRAPNGMGVGPNGEITVGDNQGTWVPACYLSLVKQGGFVSVTDLAHRDPLPTAPAQHICYLPMSVDNSSGGQTWVTSSKWGPFFGRLLHVTYGKSGLLGVLAEDVNGVKQGATFRFPFKFESGGMRARFNPTDGQLYVAGLKGWQTDGAKDGSFQRVRFTGKPVYFPENLHVTAKGISIGFTAPLDTATAGDVGNYSMEQWNYRWTKDYGSPDFKVSAPEQKGRDAVEIKSVTVSSDAKTVFLEIPDLKPVDQYRIKLNVKAQDGSDVPKEITGTIHVVAPDAKPGATYSAQR